MDVMSVTLVVCVAIIQVIVFGLRGKQGCVNGIRLFCESFDSTDGVEASITTTKVGGEEDELPIGCRHLRVLGRWVWRRREEVLVERGNNAEEELGLAGMNLGKFHMKRVVTQKLVEGYLVRAARRSDIFVHILT
ncbi:hypothetical protein JHK85_035766 [Glycine max]|nr:hypothetical protein JHK87_034973 [Glycine soja]KAG4969345.1 hypothetical protein JHK85_035766 [Glycine max]KAG4975657.1 hypothetical protein JHK86_035131 [Glycine max]